MTSDPYRTGPTGPPPGSVPGGPTPASPGTPTGPYGGPTGQQPVAPGAQGPQAPQGPQGPQGSPGPTAAPPARPEEPRKRPGLTPDGKVEHGRVSTTWVGIIVAAVLLVLLIVFIAQNSKAVTTHFLGFDGSLSLALTILIGAVIGALLVAVPGTIRIVQLRRALKQQIEHHGHRH